MYFIYSFCRYLHLYNYIFYCEHLTFYEYNISNFVLFFLEMSSTIPGMCVNFSKLKMHVLKQTVNEQDVSDTNQLSVIPEESSCDN